MDFENGLQIILSELQELKQSQADIRGVISELAHGQGGLRNHISELKQGQTAIREDFFVMQRDISDLKQGQAERYADIDVLKAHTEQIRENTSFICTNQKLERLLQRIDDIESMVMRNTCDIATIKEAK